MQNQCEWLEKAKKMEIEGERLFLSNRNVSKGSQIEEEMCTKGGEKDYDPAPVFKIS